MSEDVVQVNESLPIPLHELRFRFSRSGGPGGQKVNRTDTRVELLFDVAHSPSLTSWQRHLISAHLHNHIDGEGVLHLVSQTTASQLRNREDVVDRFRTLLRQSLHVRRKRLRTRPSRASRERRLEGKRRRSLVKRQRRSVDHEH